ncbi:MAG: hypothetical protein WKF74_02335 [Pyrinomonadaceae bacterium]
MPRIKLRECGIYALPDKREFIVRRSGRDMYSLYPPQTWKGSEFAEYRLNAEGHILSKGLPTRWRFTDLTDTGRTTESLQDRRPQLKSVK